MPKAGKRRQKATKPNQIALIIVLVAIVLLILFVRLIVFVHGGRGHRWP